MNTITCSICFVVFHDHNTPKILQCGHTFCSTCIANLFADDSNATCSFCHKDIKKDTLPTNFSLLSLVDEHKELVDEKLKLQQSNDVFQKRIKNISKICEEVVSDELEGDEFPSASWLKLSDYQDQKTFLYQVYSVARNRPVFVVQPFGNCSTRNATYGKINVASNKIYVNSLSDEVDHGSNSNASYVMDIKKCWMETENGAFLRFQCNKEGLEVVLEIQLEEMMFTNQFMKLCTGEMGPSYKGTFYIKLNINTEKQFCILFAPEYIWNGESKHGQIDYISEKKEKTFSENYVILSEENGGFGLGKIKTSLSYCNIVGLVKNVHNLVLENIFSFESETHQKILDCGYMFTLN